MKARRRPVRRLGKWAAVLLCGVIVWHVVAVAVTGGVAIFRPTHGLEVGSNGMAIRALWMSTGNGSIAWDDVGSTPEVVVTPNMVFIQLPLYIPFLASAIVAMLLLWVDSRRQEHFPGEDIPG